MELPPLPALAATAGAVLPHVRRDGALAVVVAPEEDLSALSSATGVDFGALVAAHSIGEAGSCQALVIPALLRPSPLEDLPRTLILAGAGAGTSEDLRAAGLAVARAAAGTPHLAVALGRELDAAQSAAFTEGLLLASYRMPRISAQAAPAPAPCPEILVAGGTDPDAVPQATAAVWGTFLARTLAATPANIKSPPWLAERVVELVGAESDPRLVATVHDDAWLAAQGFGATAAVGRGSATPPRLVTVSWTPEGTGAPVVLVGKGITYDTGGLSLKPREAMVPMKTDMSGAAVVLATVLAAARLRLPVPVVAVLALAENALGEAAMRPGDVVRAVDGTTIEVRNTDAEGRLVLADGLAWARRRLQPAVLVDVATLTGAATLGLGRQHAALFASGEELAGGLAEAGAAVGEPMWHMPLVEDYRQALESPVADLLNIANDDAVKGGAVIAALFLQHFVGETPWAHLDIAGTGRTGAKTPELGANAPTGFGVRALLRWLQARADDREPVSPSAGP